MSGECGFCGQEKGSEHRDDVIDTAFGPWPVSYCPNIPSSWFTVAGANGEQRVAEIPDWARDAEAG